MIDTSRVTIDVGCPGTSRERVVLGLGIRMMVGVGIQRGGTCEGRIVVHDEEGKDGVDVWNR